MSVYLEEAIKSIEAEIKQVADEIIQDPRIAKLRKLHSSLNGLEDLCERSRTPLSSILQFGPESSTEQTTTTIRLDEFYGLEPLEAAKRYLKKRGRSARLDEIVAGIRQGGGDPGPEAKLALSLARSTFEIAKISDGMFGLLEWYPHVKRGGKRRKETANGVSIESGDDATPDETTVDEALGGTTPSDVPPDLIDDEN